ncbi:MAG: hypothetical protein FJX75_08395 [Armatimonadetes bacterium]|nr:hypothetical protein [Armatimonadota bacterium]
MRHEPDFRADDRAAAAIAAVMAHPTFRHGAAWLARFGPEATVRQVVEALRDDPVVPVEWARWLLKNFGARFCPECRRCFLAKLAKHEGQETWVASFYERTPWLSDEEDALLLPIADGLPEFEYRRRNGLLRRAKEGGMGGPPMSAVGDDVPPPHARAARATETLEVA